MYLGDASKPAVLSKKDLTSLDNTLAKYQTPAGNVLLTKQTLQPRPVGVLSANNRRALQDIALIVGALSAAGTVLALILTIKKRRK